MKSLLLLLSLLFCIPAYAGQQITGSLSVSGNIGVGTVSNSGIVEALDVQGTIRSTSFTLTGNNAQTNYVLTAIDSAGDSTWQVGGAGSQTPWSSNINGAGYQLYSTGNIGVGSATPGVRLDVQGTVRALGVTITGLTTGCMTNTSGVLSSTGVACGSGSGGPGLWETNSVGIDTFSPYVGIGSTNPGTALDVNGTVRMTGFNLNGGFAAGDILVSSSVGQGTWQPASTLPLTTGVSSVSATNSTLTVSPTTGAVSAGINLATANTWTGGLTVNANPSLITGTGDNVGIGSTAPGQMLDVQGTIRSTQLAVGSGSPLTVDSLGDISTSGGYTQSGSTNNTLTGTLIMNAGAISTDTTTGLKVGTSITQKLGFYNGTPIARPSGDIITALGSSASGLNLVSAGTISQSDVTFSGTQNQAAYYPTSSTLGSTSNEYFVGSNVGIGSSAPGEQLDINGTVRMLGIALPGGAQGQVIMQNGVGIGTWSTFSGGGGGSGTVNSGTTGQGAYYPSSTTAVSGTSSIFFSGNGADNNIGINSANPGQLLDVQGTVRDLNEVVNGSSTSYFTTNVGIGTTLNSDALDIVGGVELGLGYAGQGLANASNISNSIGVQGNIGIGTWQSTSNLLSLWTTSSFPGISIENSSNVSAPNGGLYVFGNVEIGTTTSNSKFEVQGGVSIGTTFADTAAPNTGMIVQGNVGIGSSVPGQSLDVQGTVRINGLISNSTVCTTSARGNDTCWGTGSTGACLGYCTAGTFPACSTCVCC